MWFIEIEKIIVFQGICFYYFRFCCVNLKNYYMCGVLYVVFCMQLKSIKAPLPYSSSSLSLKTLSLKTLSLSCLFPSRPVEGEDVAVQPARKCGVHLAVERRVKVSSVITGVVEAPDASVPRHG